VSLLFIKILFIPLYLVGFLIPKNKKMWVFGSVSGNKYSDNSKYLYNYISGNPECKAVWLTKDKKIIGRLKHEGKCCYYFYSLKGIYSAIVAKYIVLSYSYDDVSIFCYLFSVRSKIIQLFHGTPLKKLEIEKNKPRSKIAIRKFLRLYMGKNYDLIIAASDLAAKKMDIYFKVGRDKFAVTGYPRNDALFAVEDDVFLSQLKSKVNFSKTILYLPTYRGYSSNNVNFCLSGCYGFNPERLNRFLEIHDAIFLIKLHFRDCEKAQNIISNLNNSSRIQFIRDEQIGDDIYPLLAHTDILVTDYSSVYFDYLLLNKPIVFFDYDLEEYESQDRGFYFDYGEVTPGQKVKNWDDLEFAMREILNDFDEYGREREKINHLFNTYGGGDNSERVYREILKC